MARRTGAGRAVAGPQWNVHRAPLLRGDQASGVQVPSPQADPSIVRHVLYLGGAGRETPYLSTSESEDVARYFAGKDGRIWKTLVQRARDAGVEHVSRNDLLNMLRGMGKGKARWHSALEVMMARKYVEQWAEHLLDFRRHASAPEQQIERLVQELFEVI